jgi:hypothetical protein
VDGVISSIEALLKGLSDPVILFGHFTYFLLIVSMLMRRMVWLRALAVASGITKIIYRAFFVLDPVSVLWETVFVLVNIGQLIVIWYYEKHHRFADEERHFAENVPGVERSAIKRLLELSELERYAPGTALTEEGKPVGKLLYLADGVVKVEHAGRIVAVCGPGDYIGELSFLSGNPATATATVVKPARVLAFDQKRLTQATGADAQLRRTLEHALNRNLAGKLTRSNLADVPASEALAR